MRRSGALALVAIALAAVVSVPLTAQDEALLEQLHIPVKAAGFVTDTAGALPADARAELEDLAARYQKGSGHDVAVLILPTLAGKPVEKVGLEVFRTWKLGRVDVNDGALLLIATEDHEVRIEVGRGLEGELTDLICGRIIRDVIVPHFKQGDLAGGVHDGVIAIHAAAGGDYGAIPDEDSQGNGVPPLVALFAMGAIFFLIFLLKRAGRHGRGRGIRVFPFGYPGIGGGGFRMGGFGGGGFGGGGFGGGGGGFGGFGGGGGAIGGGASGHW